MLATLRVPAALLIGSFTLAGCAGTELFGGANQVTTSSVASQVQKMDPACPSLAAQIDTLRKEGVADKIEKAAAKKYKMTPADMTKADLLTKANGEFQSKCSTLPRSAAMVPAVPAAAVAPAAGAGAATAAVASAQTTATAVAAVAKAAQ